jgi:hypothetical protein
VFNRKINAMQEGVSYGSDCNPSVFPALTLYCVSGGHCTSFTAPQFGQVTGLATSLSLLRCPSTISDRLQRLHRSVFLMFALPSSRKHDEHVRLSGHSHCPDNLLLAAFTDGEAERRCEAERQCEASRRAPQHKRFRVRGSWRGKRDGGNGSGSGSRPQLQMGPRRPHIKRWPVLRCARHDEPWARGSLSRRCAVAGLHVNIAPVGVLLNQVARKI